MIKIIEMNFTERNNLKNENILSSPIYKIYNYNKKIIPDDQTSATSDHSVINKKKIIKPNKSIPLLKVPSSVKVLFKNDNNIDTKDSFFKYKNNKKSRNFLPDISVIESSGNMKVNSEIKKSRNDNLSISNFKNLRNLKSKDYINKFKEDKIHNLKNQIQKLLKRHKLNSENNNKKLKTNLLIKHSDITRKRYYFGFINIEDNNNQNIKTLIENNNKDTFKNHIENKTNKLNFEKSNSNENLIMKTSYSVPRMKIKPLSEYKKGKIKLDIDTLIKKRFQNTIENKIANLTSRKKIKLQPLNFNKLSTKKNISTFDKVLSERDIFKKTRNKTNNNNRILKTINITKFVNLNQLGKKQHKKKVKTHQNSLFINSILKHDKKSKTLSNFTNNKSVSFQLKDNNILKTLIHKNKTLKESVNEKHNLRNGFRRKTERLIKENLNEENNFFEEENSHEYEMSNTDSEEEKKKRIQKERKKFRTRISSSTLIFSKQIIKSYEFINISPRDKKFIISLHPENLVIKKLMSSNYNQILIKTKSYIYEKIKIKEKDFIKKFSYTSEMFITKNIEKYSNESIEFFEMGLNIINNSNINQYKNAGLNHSTAFHLMNKYLSISSQLIEKFISAKTINQIDANKNKDISFIIQTQRKKSSYNMKEIKIYEKMAQKKENIIFYQNFIYSDYGEIINNLKQEEFKNIDFSDIEKKSDLEENKINQKKKKKKKINLKILRKKMFFQMKGIKRKEMSSIFDKYLRYGDEIISVIVENIERIKNKNKNDSRIGILCYRLFDYLIRNQSPNLVLNFHHRYHNFFDINMIDNDNNGDSLLIIATKENLINLVKYFLEKGADPNLTNNFGNTAMHYAISFKYFDIADVLKKNGAREDITNLKGLIPWECINGNA